MINPDDLKAELAAIEAESIGWIPLGDRAYLHVGKPDEEDLVITIVGVPDVSMAGKSTNKRTTTACLAMPSG
jgi:hypothetical protein